MDIHILLDVYKSIPQTTLLLIFSFFVVIFFLFFYFSTTSSNNNNNNRKKSYKIISCIYTLIIYLRKKNKRIQYIGDFFYTEPKNEYGKGKKKMKFFAKAAICKHKYISASGIKPNKYSSQRSI